MAFAPDGRYLATYSNSDSHLSFWQVRTVPGSLWVFPIPVSPGRLVTLRVLPHSPGTRCTPRLQHTDLLQHKLSRSFPFPNVLPCCLATALYFCSVQVFFCYCFYSNIPCGYHPVREEGLFAYRSGCNFGAINEQSQMLGCVLFDA